MQTITLVVIQKDVDTSNTEAVGAGGARNGEGVQFGKELMQAFPQ
jgi:hypothetical protein